LKAFYNNNIGDHYRFYDKCDNLFKYFIPKKFATLEQAREFLNILYGGEVPKDEDSPLIVKYNRKIDGITEKYSSYGLYQTCFFNEKGPRIL
jgi:hypothetical protein